MENELEARVIETAAAADGEVLAPGNEIETQLKAAAAMEAGQQAPTEEVGTEEPKRGRGRPRKTEFTKKVKKTTKIKTDKNGKQETHEEIHEDFQEPSQDDESNLIAGALDGGAILFGTMNGIPNEAIQAVLFSKAEHRQLNRLQPEIPLFDKPNWIGFGLAIASMAAMKFLALKSMAETFKNAPPTPASTDDPNTYVMDNG